MAEVRVQEADGGAGKLSKSRMVPVLGSRLACGSGCSQGNHGVPRGTGV